MGRKKNSALAQETKAPASAIKESLRAAGVTEMMYSVRRRMPPAKAWSWWKRNLAYDAVDDIADFCYGEGGKSYEYLITVHDPAGLPIPDPDVPDRNLGPFPLPALEDDGNAALGEDLKVKRADLMRRREDLRMKREEAALAKEEAALSVQLGEGPPPEMPMLEEDPMPWWDKAWGPPPWLMQQYGPKQPDMVKTLAALMPGIAAIIAALKPAQPATSESELILKMLPLMKGESFHPKDFLGMFAPIVQQMGQMSAEGMKALMSSMADMDSSFRERVLDLVTATGQPDDQIEKWRRALGLVKEGITEVGGSLLTRILGRGSLLDPSKRTEVKVPKLNGAQKAALPGAAPALPATPAETPAAPSAPPAPGPEGAPPTPPGGMSVEDRVRKIGTERARLLLGAIEEEMLVGSDPVVVAGKCEELYLLLPLPLRKALEAGDVGDAFETLQKLLPAEVGAFMQKVAEDKTGERKTWVEDCMQALLAGDDDFDGEEEEEDDDGEGEEDGPEPDVSDGPSKAEEPETPPEGDKP